MSELLFKLDTATVSDDLLALILRARGWRVERDTRPWETPTEFAARMDMPLGSLSRIMRRQDYPAVDLLRGGKKKSGKITSIRSNPEFELWLTHHRRRFAACAHRPS